MLPHTVTLYNTTVTPNPATFEDEITSYVTILRGVFVDASKAVNVRQSGLEGADAVSLYIPFSVRAEDETGTKKRFVPPLAFWAAEDKSGLWTLSTNGNGGSTFFVKGEFVAAPDIARAQDECFTVTKVDTRDFGSPDMQHWQVGGV